MKNTTKIEREMKKNLKVLEQVLDVSPKTEEGQEKARREMEKEWNDHFDSKVVNVTGWEQ